MNLTYRNFQRKLLLLIIKEKSFKTFVSRSRVQSRSLIVSSAGAVSLR